MFRVAFYDPRVAAWQRRLGRVPRWGWIAMAIAVLAPLAVLAATIMLAAVLSGLVILAGVMMILWIRRFFRRIAGRFHDDGRRNVRIVVRRPYDFEGR